MFEGLNLLFVLLFSLAIFSFILSLTKKCQGENSGCCEFYQCKKKSRRYWAYLMVGMVLTWIFSGESEDIYLKIAFWTILLSIFVAACTCIVLFFKNIDLYGKSYSTQNEKVKQCIGIKDLRKKKLVWYPVYYFIIFAILFWIALKDDNIITFVNQYIINYFDTKHGMTYSDFKICYSLVYLCFYAFLTNHYITIMKEEKSTMGTEVFDQDIKEFTSILHKIDLPVAFSFLFFTFVFYFLKFHPGHNDFLNYYAYGGTSLHIFLSTFIFLYGYGEEYFGLNFIKPQRAK